MRIFYGICGEGMGHAGRSIALIERLIALGHEITIFTFADAYQLLTRSGYAPFRIDGLRFATTERGSIDSIGTLCNYRSFIQNRDESLDLIKQLAIERRPELFITDFETLTARVAALFGIRCVSVDNQHKFCASLNERLPLRLRMYGRLAGMFVRRWIETPQLRLVAVFHQCPPNDVYLRVNTLLRDRMARLESSAGDHVLIYGRGEIGQQIVAAARKTRERFIVYGCKSQPADNLEFKRISYDEFAADLASCKAVVCTAGQQLIGEARYFGKPVLAIPIPNQHEQEINARLVQLERIGDFCAINQLTSTRIQHFLNQSYEVSSIKNGLDQALQLLGIRHEPIHA